MDMDRFVSEQNIARYRRLASGSITESERRKLLELLAEEEAKFIQSLRAAAAGR